MKTVLSVFIMAGVVAAANGAPTAPYANAGNPESLEQSVQGVNLNDPAVVNILKSSQKHRLPARESMITNPEGERKNYTEESSISWYCYVWAPKATPSCRFILTTQVFPHSFHLKQ